MAEQGGNILLQCRTSLSWGSPIGLERYQFPRQCRWKGEWLNTSFNIIRSEACFQVGIVGRTGAGKSSLLQALFRWDPSGWLVKKVWLTIHIPALSNHWQERSRSMVGISMIWVSTFYERDLLWCHRMELCSLEHYARICESPSSCKLIPDLWYHVPQRPTRPSYWRRIDICPATSLAPPKRSAWSYNRGEI